MTNGLLRESSRMNERPSVTTRAGRHWGRTALDSLALWLATYFARQSSRRLEVWRIICGRMGWPMCQCVAIRMVCAQLVSVCCSHPAPFSRSFVSTSRLPFLLRHIQALLYVNYISVDTNYLGALPVPLPDGLVLGWSGSSPGRQSLQIPPFGAPKQPPCSFLQDLEKY